MILRYTILYVPDVAASLDFYKRAFGLEISMIHESGDYGELVTGETKLAFSSTSLMKELGKNPQKPDLNNPTFEIAFEVEDVQSAYEKAIQAGATSIQEVRDEPWGQTTSYVGDPNGYLVEICSAVQLPNPD